MPRSSSLRNNIGYSLSTSWNASRHADGFGIIREIASMGFTSVELNFTLTETVVNDIAAMVDKGLIRVSSLHNMCPLPPEITPSGASPDHYALSSSDDDQRALAVAAAQRTIDFARRLGAKAIVLHAGRVEIKNRMRELAAAVGGGRADAVRAEMIAARAAAAGSSIANVARSLESLIPFARERGVAIGIENRCHYREIPLMNELEHLFALFGPGSLYYWHDTGHAEIFERCGFYRHKELLDKFSDRLIGLHLHDIIGPIDDHKAPGEGTFDFRLVKPYSKQDTIRVIEVHQPASGEAILRGVQHLNTVWGEARS